MIQRTLSRMLLSMALLVLTAWTLSGCGILDVENPNNLVQEDLNNPKAAAALANGALSEVADALGASALLLGTATDELTWIGSRDGWGEIEIGNLQNPQNEFTNGFFPDFGEARWTADNAIELIEGFRADGTLEDDLNLARAYIWSALIYANIADTFEDFALSNRQEAAPAIGEANMSSLYQTAIGYLDTALSIAQAEGNRDMQAQILTVRARTKHALALWPLLQNRATPPDPWVSGGVADAQAALAILGTSNDQFYEFRYSATSLDNPAGAWVNERKEQSIDDVYKFLADPVTGATDARSLELIARWDPDAGANEFASLIYASARELHLILAEDALARGQDAEAVTHINNARALGGVAAYEPGTISVGDMLKHERQANLIMQSRRLADMYRFGLQDDLWIGSSDAVRAPGTVFPITIVEKRANPFID